MATKKHTPLKDRPWVKKMAGHGWPAPKDSDQLIHADQIRTDRGTLLHSVRYRSLDHLLGVTNEVLPMTNRSIEEYIGEADDEWAYGDLGRKKSYKAMSEGRSPSEKTRVIYQQVRDSVQARILGGDISRCRSARRKRSKAWAGGTINVPAYLATRDMGPRPVFRHMSRRADRPVVRIGINVSMSCGNDATSWYRQSACAAAMAEAFENLGYGVEIVGVSCGLKVEGRSRSIAPNGDKCKSYRDFWYSISWDLKSADDPLDIERIMSVGQPALLRDVMFRAGVATCGKTPGARCLDTPEDVCDAIGVDIMIEKTWGRSGTEENAERIVGKIKELLGTESE